MGATMRVGETINSVRYNRCLFCLRRVPQEDRGSVAKLPTFSGSGTSNSHGGGVAGETNAGVGKPGGWKLPWGGITKDVEFGKGKKIRSPEASIAGSWTD